MLKRAASGRASVPRRTISSTRDAVRAVRSLHRQASITPSPPRLSGLARVFPAWLEPASVDVLARGSIRNRDKLGSTWCGRRWNAQPPPTGSAAGAGGRSSREDLSFSIKDDITQCESLEDLAKILSLHGKSLNKNHIIPMWKVLKQHSRKDQPLMGSLVESVALATSDAASQMDARTVSFVFTYACSVPPHMRHGGNMRLMFMSLEERIRRRIWKLESENFAMLLTSCANLNWQLRAVPELDARLADLASCMGAKDIASVIWALGKVRVGRSRAPVEALEARALAVCWDFDARQVSPLHAPTAPDRARSRRRPVPAALRKC